MKWVKNRPWKQWKTRKITLVGVIIVWITYIIISIIMGFMNHSIDSTVTENVFSGGKWLITTGCAITIAKIFKGNTNSDNDESIITEEQEEETE